MGRHAPGRTQRALVASMRVTPIDRPSARIRPAPAQRADGAPEAPACLTEPPRGLNSSASGKAG